MYKVPKLVSFLIGPDDLLCLTDMAKKFGGDDLIQ